tara:strand:- start:877 stop:1815 length:939 start_codon:yes stop_codon:yes gene_type:complete
MGVSVRKNDFSAVIDGLVFCIDPTYVSSVNLENRISDLSNVSDLVDNIQYTAQNNGSGSTKPDWEASSGGGFSDVVNGDAAGILNFENVTSSQSNYSRINLGSGVDGKTVFSIGDSYTVDFWFKQGAINYDYYYYGATLYGNQYAFVSYTDTGNYTQRYPLRVSIGYMDSGSQTDGEFNFIVQCLDQIRVSGGDTRLYSLSAKSPTVTAGNWYHFCGIIDMADQLGGGVKAYSYLNGSLSESNAVSTTGSGHTFSGYSGNIMLCSNDSSGSTTYHKNPGAKGKMGAFRIYNRALTAAEVLQNYNASKERFGL